MNDADTTDAIKGWLSLISIVAALLFVLVLLKGAIQYDRAYLRGIGDGRMIAPRVERRPPAAQR